MKVVLDANIYVSALVSTWGNPYRIFELWLQKRFDVLITTPMLEEIGRVLHYPRIVKRHRLDEIEIERFVTMLADQAWLVESKGRLAVVQDDESDNRYIECAVAGRADYIVTGDEHLLKIQQFRDIFILKPAEFVALLNAEDDNFDGRE